ncbi:phage tail protein [Pseudomonas mosselii]|jgi:phage protein U|uniref:Phage tail protein n=1 Tax=Pseudomonas mosselii TaxID=78327 RepID=A0ABX9AWV5_9PSED|nr:MULTISPECIES: phage tail protein [Pseudomonas]MBC3457938.1 phage tail protein [Pseudomonas mosselii]MBH3308540.1 phage tail protein [Pseudomonas mosselii]MBH3322965.1 phage tail protein [Pseudomonas mosselii]MDH1509786.1 phage tail protein [Pseudomonas mosselii]MDH1526854.1 phage tail protein [Pseudomonas mosselii]
MTYLEQLQATLHALVKAGEAGRRRADAMLDPMNDAIVHIQGAVGELEGLPVVGPIIGAKLQRTMRAITNAQARVAKVVAKYDQAVAVVRQVRDRIDGFAAHAAKAGAAIRRVVGEVRSTVNGVLSTLGFAPEATPAAEAVKPFPHLLVLQPLKAGAAPYYFNLDTAAFDQLRRQTRFRWAGQERLSRANAQQAVSLGEESINIRGAIFPGFKGGLGQLQTLRSIGRQLLPLSLTTGYGEVLGTWCLTSIEEEQSVLLAGGIPRKQGFSLEFVSYGQDLHNV